MHSVILRTNMAAFVDRFPGLSDTQHASANHVVVYDSANISSVRKCAVVVRASLKRSKCLDALESDDKLAMVYVS